MPEPQSAPSRVDRLLALRDSERFRWVLVFIVLELFAAVRAANPQERDQYWSARAGVENLNGLPLIRPDTWSWSADGDWVPNSPAWNVVLGLSWQAGGFWGLFVVTFASISVFFALAVLVARVTGARALPTLIGFAPVLVIGLSAFTPRATVVVQSMLFAAALFAWWWGGRVGHRRALRASLPVVGVGFGLSLVGNWLHLSFMAMAPAIAAMWAIAWWLSPRMSSARRWQLTAGGTLGLVLGCLLSPYGIPLTLDRARIVSEACRGLVAEWLSMPEALQSRGPSFLLFIALVVLIAIGAVTTAARLLRRDPRNDHRSRIVVPLAVVGVAALAVGVASLRFAFAGLLLLLPVIAVLTTSLVARCRRWQARSNGVLGSAKAREYLSGQFWTVILAGIGIVVTVLAIPSVLRGAAPAEAAAVRALPSGCRLWSTDTVGGTTILIRPDVPVWTDGRADFYGREHLIEYLETLSGSASLPSAADCVILPVSGAADVLAASIEVDPAWRRLAVTDGYIAWARD